MPNARTAAGCVVALALIAAATASDGASSSGDRRFWNARAGVGVEAPVGWALSVHGGYPSILCVLVHPGGSRISLAVDQAVSATDAAALIAESRPGLAAQGIELGAVAAGPRGGLLVEAQVPHRKQVLRQLYLVRPIGGPPPGRQAVVLTLTTTPADLQAASGALDWVIAHLELEAPLRSDGQPDGGS